MRRCICPAMPAKNMRITEKFATFTCMRSKLTPPTFPIRQKPLLRMKLMRSHPYLTSFMLFRRE